MNTNVKVIGTLVVLPANGYDGVEDHLTLEDEPDADGLLRNSVLPLVEKKASVTEIIASSKSKSSAIKPKLGPLIKLKDLEFLLGQDSLKNPGALPTF